MTKEIGRARAEDLASFTDHVVDLAAGLGDSLIVAGLSTSGVLAAWAAQRRPEVRHAVVIAPLFAPAGAPAAWTVPITRLFLWLPDFFVWWDPRRRENLRGPQHVYPRFPTRLVGESMRLGLELK